MPEDSLLCHRKRKRPVFSRLWSLFDTYWYPRKFSSSLPFSLKLTLGIPVDNKSPSGNIAKCVCVTCWDFCTCCRFLLGVCTLWAKLLMTDWRGKQLGPVSFPLVLTVFKWNALTKPCVCGNKQCSQGLNSKHVLFVAKLYQNHINLSQCIQWTFLQMTLWTIAHLGGLNKVKIIVRLMQLRKNIIDYLVDH